MYRKIIGISLVVVLTISLAVVSVALAQTIPPSLLSINMTGVTDSLLTIGMEGVDDSHLVIDWWLLLRPSPPTNFVASQLDITTVGLTWDMGYLADTTIIRISELRYPTTVTEGYAACSGNGTSCNVTGLTLGESNIYYFSAWSENEAGYSLTYATAQIGGDTMVLWLFGFLGLGLMGMFFWKRLAFLSYGAAGVWALMGFQALQTSAGSNPTQIIDTYMALFWLSIGFVIACSLIPTIMREKPEKEDIYVDAVGDDMTPFMPDKTDKPRVSRTTIARFGRTGEPPK